MRFGNHSDVLYPTVVAVPAQEVIVVTMDNMAIFPPDVSAKVDTIQWINKDVRLITRSPEMETGTWRSGKRQRLLMVSRKKWRRTSGYRQRLSEHEGDHPTER